MRVFGEEKHNQETRSAANSYWPKIVGVTGPLSTRDGGALTHTHTYTAAPPANYMKYSSYIDSLVVLHLLLLLLQWLSTGKKETLSALHNVRA